MAFGESVVARGPGGQVASHIYLVGKSTSQKTAFGEFAVARWPGGQSHLSSRKIYISEARLAGRFAPGRAKCAPPSLHHSPPTLKVRGAKSKKAPAFHDPLRHQDSVKVTVPPMLAKFPLPFV